MREHNIVSVWPGYSTLMPTSLFRELGKQSISLHFSGSQWSEFYCLVIIIDGQQALFLHSVVGYLWLFTRASNIYSAVVYTQPAQMAVSFLRPEYAT